MATLSPSLTLVTPSPTLVTTPAACKIRLKIDGDLIKMHYLVPEHHGGLDNEVTDGAVCPVVDIRAADSHTGILEDVTNQLS